MTVTISAVWDRTAEFLSDRLNAVFAIAALGLFVPAVIWDVLTPLGAAGEMATKLGLGALGLALGVVSLWAQLAITALALDPAITAGVARSCAVGRLGALILVTLAIFAIGILAGLPVIGIIAAYGVDLRRLGDPAALQAIAPGGAAAIGFYALVAVPVMLWLAARAAVLPTAVVVAEQRALGAIARAFRLTRGLALKIIGVLLLYVVVSWVATSATRSVVGALLGLLVQGDGPITVATVGTALFVAMTGTIFSVISTAFAAKLYLAARAREDAAAGAPTA